MVVIPVNDFYLIFIQVGCFIHEMLEVSNYSLKGGDVAAWAGLYQMSVRSSQLPRYS
jgi:hypothetical protein